MMDNSTLVLTQIIFRDGQRAPDSKFKYPGDPYAQEKYLPYGPDELTLIGRKQSYYFGQKLRKRYGNFVGSEFYHGLLDAKSSECSRAITTLQLVLAGLFPPTPSSQIDEQLTWQPIPFTYKHINEDNLIGCALSNMYNHEDSPEFRKTQNSLDVVKCVEENLKWCMKVHAQSMMLYDTIDTQIGLGFKVPDWCANIFPDKLRQDYECFTRHNFNRKSFLIGACGGLIQEINKIITQKVCAIKYNQPEKVSKMYLYSGHGLNLQALLSVFKRFDATKFPRFNANLVFELHQINGNYFVRILYQNGPTDPENYIEQTEIEEITLPNSNNAFWKLSDFTSYVLDYFPCSEVPFNKRCCY